ncbi:hypothetical protein HYPSUDRAFT_331609 [Hypholoma sublateritium FD-334 SS-4]|uniref:Carboxymuconolactone decarboxylase-like domain-containing protein n=1 Tax=Hypholoma sublateritium (strain FD-334 SS-4) TaxID=945553 RepID=A0A0D2NH18_HYPSF|nr:hypothetical protein HYPSUDRAFT_331609 [Hypholoma sublateritium FD-334 SS-4]
MASSFRVSAGFLNGLKALFPETSNTIGPIWQPPMLKSPWYIVAAVAFSASNRPEGVPQVFEHALADLRASLANAERTALSSDNEKLLAQRFRDALFKSGLISGYPKAINSLKSLHEAMPVELWETAVSRDTGATLTSYEVAGQSLWRSVYGEKSGSVQALLDSIYPDMGEIFTRYSYLCIMLKSRDLFEGWFSRAIGYGLVYGHTDFVSPLETSYTLVAALIAGDTPQQIDWHLEGAQRGGATFEEVSAVREASIKVAELSGIQWRHPIPEVKLVTERQP